MKQILLVLVLLVAQGSAYAQKSNSRSLGWDLTYSSVLNTNHVAPNEWLWKWLGPNYKSPIGQLVSDWNDEPIVSSILIEHPAFHAGEHITLWFVRTKNHAYHWDLIERKPPRNVKAPLDPALYDKFFAELSSWQQAKPVSADKTPVGGVPGFMGFLSLYDHGNSRQILLTLDDFWLCDTKKCEGGKAGRLTQAMEILPHG
jgi:hypothetical protein